MNKIIAIALILSVTLLASMIVTPILAAPPVIKRPMDFYATTIEGGNPQTVDYSFCYDTASGEICFNTMDTLIQFDGEHSDAFIGDLAKSWSYYPINKLSSDSIEGLYFENNIAGTTYDSATGMYKGNTGAKATYTYQYDFTLNDSIPAGLVHFQPFPNGTQGYVLTAQDIVYSFQRTLVQDRSSGPQWMLQEPLLDTNLGADIALVDPIRGPLGLADWSEASAQQVGHLIKDSVTTNGTDIFFNIMFPSAYAPFYGILTQTWSGIESQQWIVNQVIGAAGRPDWDGNWTKSAAEIPWDGDTNGYGFTGTFTGWLDENLQTLGSTGVSPLDSPTPMEYGSGPFQLTTLSYSSKFWSMTRFVNYWRGWPAMNPSLGGSTPAGYVNTIEETWAFTWGTRKALFMNGDCDFTALGSNQNIPELYQHALGPGYPAYDPPNYPWDGIRCIHPLYELAVDGVFFTFDINPATFWGPIGTSGTFNINNIPPDFFGNSTWGVHIRKAFAYAFDYATFLSSVVLGEGFTPATAIIPGLPYYNAAIQGYNYNITRAKQELALAGPDVNGKYLPQVGFTLTLVYNTGNLERQKACDLLKAGLELCDTSPGAHYKISETGVEWSPYLTAAVQHKIPCFIIGWLADYPDPHDFAFPFYHTGGSFAIWQLYSNPTMDNYIDAGILDTAPAARQADYNNVQNLAVQDCPSFMILQPLGRHFERDWVVGYYFNAIYPGGYFYNRWKWYYTPLVQMNTATQPQSYDLPADVNYNGKVDMKDIGVVSRSYGSTAYPMSSRWNFKADVNNDRKVDMKDIGFVARSFGKISAVWAPGFSVSIDPITSYYNFTDATPIAFTATVSSGTPTYSYKWYTDMNSTTRTIHQIVGATSSTLDLAPDNTTATDNPYEVYVVATDSASNVATSQLAFVFTEFEVHISPYPGDGANQATGAPAVEEEWNGTGFDYIYFTSTHSNAQEPVTYQWYMDSAPIVGATSSSYVYEPTTTGDHFFYLNVTDVNLCWVVSDTTEVYIDFIMTIAPAGPLTISAGSTQVYTATYDAGTATPVTYDWRIYYPTSGSLFVTPSGQYTFARTSTFTFNATISSANPYYSGPGSYWVRCRVVDYHGIRHNSNKSKLIVT